MKKIAEYGKLIGLAAAALVMTAALTLEGVSAYFTTYVSAGGSKVVSLGSSTELVDEVVAMIKQISVKNLSGNECYVRVRVFYAEETGIKVTYIYDKEKWEYNSTDGYWYYQEILPADGTTERLDVKIDTDGLDTDKIDNFNVVVVQECTPVVYDEDGKPTADWNAVYSYYKEKEADQ